MFPLSEYLKETNKNLKETLPESLAMMVSFLLYQLREAEKKVKLAQSEANNVRVLNNNMSAVVDSKRKEIKRLIEEIQQLKKAAAKPAKKKRSKK